MGVSRNDGFRLLFKTRPDRQVDMIDELGELPTIQIPQEHAELLAELLAMQHNMKRDKENMFAKLYSLLDIVEEKQTKVDKDILITCIQYVGDLE